MTIHHNFLSPPPSLPFFVGIAPLCQELGIPRHRREREAEEEGGSRVQDYLSVAEAFFFSSPPQRKRRGGKGKNHYGQMATGKEKNKNRLCSKTFVDTTTEPKFHSNKQFNSRLVAQK